MRCRFLAVAATLLPGFLAPRAPAIDVDAETQIRSGTLAPAYPVPYEPASTAQIKAVLDRVLTFLETASPVRIVDRDTSQPVADLTHLPARPAFAPTPFLLTSYEWGVTYSGMLHAAAATGDLRYRDYVDTRLGAITAVAARLQQQPAPAPDVPRRELVFALVPVLHPRTLDDSGSMAAAMIEAARAGIRPVQLRPRIDCYLEWIRTGQSRLPDGTLARSRPLPDSLWLDDLYMSVPALAQMGALTGDSAYFDDAVKQVLQFSARMFVPAMNLYRHGWVQAMDPHPTFYWGRANGWAVVAMTELLDVLPANHPGRAAVLAQYRSHVAGLAAVQDHTGLWHQLLNRSDTYLETSASAMFVYAITHGINRGWLDATAYGPMASVGWNAVAQKVNATGQVEGTCVGTGMAFEPTYYAFRPTNVLAAHGYGPVLLAGSEMMVFRSGLGANGIPRDGGLRFEAPRPSEH
jgi:unsaturated rhamnogalacturonyl hydrolase